jgi:hypothetical protein
LKESPDSFKPVVFFKLFFSGDVRRDVHLVSGAVRDVPERVCAGAVRDGALPDGAAA